MQFTTEHFTDGELEELAKEVKLDENIDYGCDFIVAKQDNKIIGVAGINFIKNKIPRWEHIIISKPYQKTRLTTNLLKEMEKTLLDKGYKLYSAFILNSKFYLQKYIEKFGFVLWEKRMNGNWYLKSIRSVK